MRLKATKH